MKGKAFFSLPDNFHCSLMWIEEDAFYPGSYFKETLNVHPEWNVASGIAQVFFLLLVFLILDVLFQTRTKDSQGSSIPGGSCLLFEILKSNKLLIHPHP